MTLSQMLNPFGILAELDDAASGGLEPCTAAPPEPPTRPQPRASAPARAVTTYKGTLYVHDSSNQRACCLSVPASSLASTRSLAQFLIKRGFSMPPASLLTAHEDRVPCDLRVVPMAAMEDTPILTRGAPSADCILHLFMTHGGASAGSLLQAFANVHPDCFRTLADCAQQPTVPTSGGDAPVALQAYLEAAFEASVRTDTILYNDCDSHSLKAEWCVWNTGLLWKEHAHAGGGAALGSGYIFLFFKRSLSRVAKGGLTAFPLDCPRHSKPWTMNRPKPVSDVTQWLNGAPAPGPPPAELVATLISRQAAVRPISTATARPEPEDSPSLLGSPCTPTISEESIGMSSDLASSQSSNLVPSECPGMPDASSAAPIPCPPPMLPSLSLMAHATSPASTAPSTPTSQQSGRSTPSLGTGGSKAAKHRRRRRRSHGKKAPASLNGSSPVQHEAGQNDAAKEMEAHIDELVAALQKARSETALQTCGWISSMCDQSADGPSGAAAGSWAAGQLDWVL